MASAFECVAQPGDRVSIGLLLLPDFSISHASVICEVFEVINRLVKEPMYDLKFLTLDGKPARQDDKLTLGIDSSLRKVKRIAVLFVLSRFHPDRYWTPELAGQLRRLAATGTAFGGIGEGSYILARSGLLHAHKTTIHWDWLEQFAETFPEIKLAPDGFVIDRNRYSATGTINTIRLLVRLIQERHGPYLASEVARRFYVDGASESDDLQKLALLGQLSRRNATLASAIGIMLESFGEPVPIPEIASSVGSSQRKLNQLFQRYLKMSPRRYYLNERLDSAKRLIEQTDMPLLAIADRCGFKSASAFTRAFLARYATGPANIRRQARAETRRVPPGPP